LSAMLLKPRREAHGWASRFFSMFNRGFAKATSGYVRVSHGLVRKAFIGVALLLALTAAAALIGRRLPTGFVPDEDYGYALMQVQLPPAASLERTDAVARKIDQLLSRTEGVANFSTIAGFSLVSRVTASNYGFYFIGLKPWDERPGLEARTIVNRINAQLRTVAPEATAFALMPPSIPGLGTQGGFSFWIQDRTGGTLDFLNQNVQKFIDAARRRPELVGVTTQFTAAVPQLFAYVDRDKVLKQGIALPDVYLTMQAFLGGVFVNQFNRFGRQWRVFLQAEGAERTSPAAIGQFYVRNNDGSMVPLSTLESTKPTFGPQYTNRFNVYRAALVTGAAAPRYSSGQALDALEQVARDTLPREISYDWSDLSYQEKNAGGSGPLFALSIAFVFLILAALYESWSLPFSVLLSVPVAVFGAVLGLMLRRYDFNVYAQIGVIMLIGLAAKNAILIVEFAKARLEEGINLVEAALEGAKLRLRPILMTSFAFILGCVPLWFASGSGGASRRILGTVVVTGMLAATLIAIFIIPLLFVLVERLIARRTAVHGRTPDLVPGEGS
jgi:hydrophobe/amphiphile efflux-1 (HAE1) family protein